MDAFSSKAVSHASASAYYTQSGKAARVPENNPVKMIFVTDPGDKRRREKYGDLTNVGRLIIKLVLFVSAIQTNARMIIGKYIYISSN